MKEKNRTCDPSQCDHCEYVGEGGFICDKYQQIVVDDWLPTHWFEMCFRQRVKEVKCHAVGRSDRA